MHPAREDEPASSEVIAGTASRSGETDRNDLDTAMTEDAPGVVREFLDFLRDNKKWWLLPVLIVLALLGLLVVVGGTAVAPFIYTLF